MKLVTYEADGATRAGVIVGETIVDASAALESPITLRDVQAILELDRSPLDRLRDAIAKPGSRPAVALEAARLRSPILRPPTVRDYMIFEEHASGQGSREPSEAWFRLPVFYFSNTLRIYGPDEEVPYPTASQALDYEFELGCVIGREGSDVKEADAMSYIAGFTIFNDWSCRDLQFDEMQVRLGPAKGKDAATSLGPWLVTTDELAPQLRDGRLHVSCTIRVNGDTWLTKGRGGYGGDAEHTWGAMIERASRDSRIVPGDVLGSGTVGGGSIGEAIRKGYDARFLQPGDVVELEAEGIGVLRNRIATKADPDPSYRFRAAQPVTPGVRGSAKDYVYAGRRR